MDALRELGFDSYADYLRSPHWARLRARYHESRPWVCICGQRTRLHLHHVTYERLGEERLDDVRPLCPPCHARLHELHRAGMAGLDPEAIAHRLIADRALAPRDGEPERVDRAYEEGLARRALDARPHLLALQAARRLTQSPQARLRQALADAKAKGLDVRAQARLARLAMDNGRSSAHVERRVRAVEARVYPSA